MKINQLSEIINAGVPQVIVPDITLTVDAVYPTKAGTGKKGPWHCQNLGCSDDSGKIRVSVWNHSELGQEIKGSTIKLKSIEGKRGLSGVVCEMNEWEKNGEQHKDLQLKVNDSGIIITQAGSVGSKSLDTGYDKKQTPGQEGSATVELAWNAPREDVATITPKPVKTDPSAKLSQFAALYQACLDKADLVKHIGFSNEDYRQIATAFWIQGMRENLHLHMKTVPNNEDEIPF